MSLTCIQPPIFPPPAPPWWLAPPAPSFGRDKLKPPGEAKAAAWPCTMRSWGACSANTEDRRGTNSGFEVKFCGVTGSEEAVPMDSWGVGGFVGRRERRDFVGSIGSL